jgi:hypothetical protein
MASEPDDVAPRRSGLSGLASDVVRPNCDLSTEQAAGAVVEKAETEYDPYAYRGKLTREEMLRLYERMKAA